MLYYIEYESFCVFFGFDVHYKILNFIPHGSVPRDLVPRDQRNVEYLLEKLKMVKMRVAHCKEKNNLLSALVR